MNFWYKRSVPKPEKLDDVEWHIQTTQGDEKRAATHIGMALCWLVQVEDTAVLDADLKDLISRKGKTPSTMVLDYFDGKLITFEDTPPAVVKFLKEVYWDVYLADYENKSIPSVEYDASIPEPYNMIDNWENASAVSKYFDEKYLEWRKDK